MKKEKKYNYYYKVKSKFESSFQHIPKANSIEQAEKYIEALSLVFPQQKNIRYFLMMK